MRMLGKAAREYPCGKCCGEKTKTGHAKRKRAVRRAERQEVRQGSQK